MSVPNLADPDVEPTDDELLGLMRRDMEDVRTTNQKTRERVRSEIALEREKALARLNTPAAKRVDEPTPTR